MGARFKDGTRPLLFAEAILLIAANEYPRRIELDLKDLAPYILTTGGAGGDPRYTEADVGRAYLIQHQVPSEDILTDPEGSTTAQSLAGAAEIMHRMNLYSCIVVSDGYHIYRVKRLLQARGIQVFGSPRPSSGVLMHGQGHWLYVRQAVGFVLWQVGINV